MLWVSRAIGAVAVVAQVERAAQVGLGHPMISHRVVGQMLGQMGTITLMSCWTM
jgi:hypothetical protein